MKQGWEIKKLGDLSKKKDAVVSGPFGSNLKVSDYKSEGVPILRLQNIGKGYFIDKDIKYINEEKAKELKYHSFISGDIALAKLGIPIGKTCIIPNQLKSGIITADIVRIRPDKHVVDYNFLEYFLNTDLSVSQLTGNISGATRPRVNLSDVRDIEIPLPPLPEQQRIVSILDEAFAAIAKAKANAERNLRNAREVFESYLQGVFEGGGEGWEVKILAEVAKHSLGKMLDKNKNKGNLQRYLRNQSVRWFEFDLNDLTEMPFLENEKDKYTAVKGDVLICEGGYPGRAAIWQEDYPIFFQKAIHRVRFHKPDYNKWFLYHLYLSDKTGKLKEHFSGTGIQHFTGEALAKYLIPLPPSNKVGTIVQKLDTLSAETKKLESIYQQKINALEEMKKSILEKAFSGGL